MITETGYSKDPSIMPEGIAVTMGMSMIEEKGGLKSFLKWFNDVMSTEDDLWYHKCKNKPTKDIIYVYVIVANRLYCRCIYGGWSDDPVPAYTLDENGNEVDFMTEWPRIILAGPIEKPNFKRKLSGFRGFRYTTKLF